MHTEHDILHFTQLSLVLSQKTKCSCPTSDFLNSVLGTAGIQQSNWIAGI
jgi:hypothetical protein